MYLVLRQTLYIFYILSDCLFEKWKRGGGSSSRRNGMESHPTHPTPSTDRSIQWTASLLYCHVMSRHVSATTTTTTTQYIYPTNQSINHASSLTYLTLPYLPLPYLTLPYPTLPDLLISYNPFTPGSTARNPQPLCLPPYALDRLIERSTYLLTYLLTDLLTYLLTYLLTLL